MTDMSNIENSTCSLLGLNISAPHLWNVTGKENNETSVNNISDISQDISAPNISKLHFLFMFMDAMNVLGCIVVIMLIYKESKLRDTPGRLLLNHTLADGYVGLSFLLMNIPIFTVTDKSMLKKLRLFHIMLISVTGAEGIFSLTMILFSLHLAICNPIFYKLHCRTRYVVIFVIVSWLFNLLFMCSAFLVEDIMDKESNTLIIWLFLDEYYLMCVAVHVVLTFLVPLLIIIFCYARIALYARRQQHVDVFTQSTTKTYIQQAKGIMLISITYFLTQVPGYVFETLTKALGKSDRDDQLVLLKAIMIALIYVYLVLKLPLILYGFKSYRRVFLDMCCCKRSLTRTNMALEHRPGRVYTMTDQIAADRSLSQ